MVQGAVVTAHALQAEFATVEGEALWCDRLRGMIEAGELDAAEGVLAAELSAIDSDLARLCLATSRESVVISGWPELIEAITLHEGEPVTGLALAIGNEADLAFEKGRLITPYVMLGIYTDEGYPWSAAARADLLAQAKAESPAWAGHDEDIEVYLEVEGLEALNTALIHHKHRFFMRDGNPPEAPLRYVEYVLGCWWRTLKFHQAVATELAVQGLPGDIPVVAGLVDMAPEVASVHVPAGRATASTAFVEPVACAEALADCEEELDEEDAAAELFSADFVQRKPVEEVKEVSGADLRRRVVAVEDQPSEKRGFFARLFRRR